MNNNYKILKAIREYPNSTDRHIAKMCAVRTRLVHRLRYPKPITNPRTGVKYSGTYFIKDQRGRVKIGASTNIPARFSDIQVGNADELTLLAVLDIDETDLHTKFDKYHIRGEWFTLSNEIKEYLR